MKIFYPAFITHDKRDDRYLVEFPDLKEAITEGLTFEGALFNAAEVLTLTLEARIEEGWKIPKPNRKIKKAYLITPSARVQSAILIHLAKGKHTTSHIARALGTSWPAAARLEDPRHWPTLKQLERAVNVLGHQLTLSIEPIKQI